MNDIFSNTVASFEIGTSNLTLNMFTSTKLLKKYK